MKKLIEILKANKKVIIKRTLIGIGAVTGLIIAGKLLAPKDPEVEDATECEDSDEEATDEESSES